MGSITNGHCFPRRTRHLSLDVTNAAFSMESEVSEGDRDL